MGLIPAQTLEEIRGRLDIVELVSEFVPNLQRAGRNMKGRCPFHQERTPSFIVSPERQTFHCFGCGEGGDAFAFLMKIENLGFMEAATKLAERAGVKIVPADEELGPEQRERLKAKELLAWAADFYHELLAKSPDAQAARRYFEGRHVSPASSAAFKLGFAPRTGVLVAAAARKGFARELLVKAGLAAPSKTGSGLRDYFFDRVLFPIRDPKGAVVGFGARTMGDAMPKYLNSPDSPVFAKGRVLYGLSEGLAAVRKARQALLMEGYMDVIAAHQHGLVQACAPLGTALTPDHAALIKRYADEAVIVFDADSAGLNAAIRGAELLLAAGLEVRIATVPEGKDPDEHLHKFGVEAFRRDCLGKATALVEFKTELLLSRQKGPLSPAAKSAVAKEVLATIEQCPDEIKKSEWYRKLAQRLDVDERTFRSVGQAQARPAARPAPAPGADAAMHPADKQLLDLLFKSPGLAAEAREGDFLSGGARRIWTALVGLAPHGADWSARLLSALPPAERTLASRLLVQAPGLESEDTEKELRKALSRRRNEARFAELAAALKAGRALGPTELSEYQRITVELKGTRR